MKKIIIEVSENSHRCHILMKLLRGDNYIFSIENESKALRQPLVSGSLLFAELLQKAELKNEDGMPVVEYVDKPNGGSVAYLRHDAVVKKLNQLLSNDR